MKNLILKFSSVIASFAFMFTVLMANRTCMYAAHQPKLPESVKKLRKF